MALLRGKENGKKKWFLGNVRTGRLHIGGGGGKNNISGEMCTPKKIGGTEAFLSRQV